MLKDGEAEQEGEVGEGGGGGGEHIASNKLKQYHFPASYYSPFYSYLSYPYLANDRDNFSITACVMLATWSELATPAKAMAQFIITKEGSTSIPFFVIALAL